MKEGNSIFKAGAHPWRVNVFCSFLFFTSTSAYTSPVTKSEPMAGFKFTLLILGVDRGDCKKRETITKKP